MSVFVVSSASVAAGLAVAFEIGRVIEKRSSGISKEAVPFQGFDWKSDSAKTAAYVFVGLFLVEVSFLPRSWNPFSYIGGLAASSEDSFSSYLAFFVFGSWSGLLAVGYGSLAGSFQALQNERAGVFEELQNELSAFESEKSKHEASKKDSEDCIADEMAKIEKHKRANIASAAAVHGEWKKLHIANQEHNMNVETIRSENEKIWSKNLCQDFDKKTMHVVDNALDKRWREVENQGNSLEEMRKRNKEKEKKLKELRAKRAERATTQEKSLDNEKLNLIKLTNELETLKVTMEEHKKDNMRKEQEKIRELKNRAEDLQRKEKDLENVFHKKMERVRVQERTLKEKEDKFESGEERKRLQELSEKLEASRLNVGKFNEEVMSRERQKLAEFRERENILRKREEELFKIAASTASIVDNAAYPDSELAESTEEMPDDEASSYLEVHEEERPDHEIHSTANNELPIIKEGNASNNDVQQGKPEMSATNQTVEDGVQEGDLTEESESSDGDDLSTSMSGRINRGDSKSVSMHSIRLLTERSIYPMSEDEMDESPSTSIEEEGKEKVDDDNDDRDHDSIELNPRLSKVSSFIQQQQQENIKTKLKLPSSLIDMDDGKEEDEVDEVSAAKAEAVDVEDDKELEGPTTDNAPIITDEDRNSIVVEKSGTRQSLLDLDDDSEEEENDAKGSKESLLSLEDGEGFENAEEGSKKSLFDFDDDEEIDYKNDSVEVLVDDDDCNDNDSDSDASTCMLNVTEKELDTLAQTFPVAQSIEKQNNASSSSNHPPLLESDSDDDSLFNVIQKDIAAVKQEREEVSKLADALGITTSVRAQPTTDGVLSVSSPLSERNENATFDDEITSPKSQNKTTMDVVFKDETISATLTNTSMLSFKEGAPMTPSLSEIISTSNEESFKDALTIAATSSSNPEYVILSKAEKEHENDLVVSEDAGVEVIAWN